MVTTDHIWSQLSHLITPITSGHAWSHLITSVTPGTSAAQPMSPAAYCHGRTHGRTDGHTHKTATRPVGFASGKKIHTFCIAKVGLCNQTGKGSLIRK